MRVSETFRDVMTSAAGSLYQTCCCGKCYFAGGSHAIGWEEGELEEFQERARKEPDKFIESPDDSIAWAAFHGWTFVWDCENCPTMARVEDLIWSERRRVAEFIKRRVAEEKEKADKDSKITEGLDL